MDRLPKVGERVQVRENYDGAPWYPTRVEDRSNNQVSLAAPLKSGNIVAFSEGAKLQVYFERPDAMYTFVSEIVSRRMIQENLRVYDLAEPETIQRLQRRAMFRLSLLLELTYQVVSTPNKDNSMDAASKSGCIKDISGGGLRLIAEDEFPKGTVIDMAFPEDSLNLHLLGEVVNIHVKEGERAGNTKYEYGIKFVELDRNTQDKIISFIFEEQRRRRRRELAVQ